MKEVQRVGRRTGGRGGGRGRELFRRPLCATYSAYSLHLQ